MAQIIPDNSQADTCWIAAAAADTGPSHLRDQMPCQDFCDVVIGSSGLVVAALADGLGSEPCAEDGARIAVDCAVAKLVVEEESLLSGDESEIRDICTAALTEAIDAINQQASDSSREVTDYSCTLIVIAMAPSFIASICIGDGFVIWRPAQEQEYQLLLGPEKGEFFNEVQPITTMDMSRDVRFELRREPPGLVLASSDGLLDLALKADDGMWLVHTPFCDFTESLVRRSDFSDELLLALYRHPQVVERNGDDKSLVVVATREGLKTNC